MKRYELSPVQQGLVRQSISRSTLAGIYQVKPFCEERTYRKALRVVIGYTFVKIGSHHMSGLVHEKIVAYGDTFDAAIAKLAGDTNADA